jgi:hypothetical protein
MAKSKKPEAYGSYPPSCVILCNLAEAAIVLLGAFILFGFGWAVPAAYLLYCLTLEFRILRMSCPNCYYYGKRCFCGKGLCAARLFKRGDPKIFLAKKITWLDILPDFMVSIVPIVCGAILLSINFDWAILTAVVAIGILGFPAQGIIHGWGCKHCRQREIGCPACELFSKKGKKK